MHSDDSLEDSRSSSGSSKSRSRGSRSSSRSRSSDSRSGKQKYSSEERWLEDLQKFLIDSVIPNTTRNQQIQSALVSESAMNVWSVAFTHNSVNPNKGQNYEILEKLGDKVIGLIFVEYLLEKFPDFGTRELSELPNFYLSKEQLASISNRLQLTKLARSKIRNINLEEDIFESVFGALFTIGNQMVQQGVGYLLSKRFLYWIFDNHVEIDPEKARGKPKTQVMQIFQKAGWDIKTEWDEKTGTFTIYFSDKAIKNLRERMGYYLSSKILARVEGKQTKTAAEEEAFKIALDRLAEMNITIDNIKTIMGDSFFKRKDVKPLLEELNKKLKEAGVSSIFFKTFVVKGNQVKVQLLGINEDNKSVILAESDGDSIQNAKINAINNFLGKQRG